MIERIADVIKTQFGSEVSDNKAEKVARFIIVEMHEPTEAMRIAALNLGLPGPCEPPLYEKVKVWRAMMAEALK